MQNLLVIRFRSYQPSTSNSLLVAAEGLAGWSGHQLPLSRGTSGWGLLLELPTLGSFWIVVRQAVG